MKIFFVKRGGVSHCQYPEFCSTKLLIQELMLSCYRRITASWIEETRESRIIFSSDLSPSSSSVRISQAGIVGPKKTRTLAKWGNHAPLPRASCAPAIPTGQTGTCVRRRSAKNPGFISPNVPSVLRVPSGKIPTQYPARRCPIIVRNAAVDAASRLIGKTEVCRRIQPTTGIRNKESRAR